LTKPQEPHPAKATLYLPSPPAGRGWGWGAMTMGITTNYPDMISQPHLAENAHPKSLCVG
ncbi:hypothetical protein, partial [Nostoc sp. NOS(2021)]|uniref:hypothetical protein n=1 Tax=Nostoc sp. NOS(2021) TaxID=2815407 RepID=UPI0025F6CC73